MLEEGDPFLTEEGDARHHHASMRQNLLKNYWSVMFSNFPGKAWVLRPQHLGTVQAEALSWPLSPRAKRASCAHPLGSVDPLFSTKSLELIQQGQGVC